MSRNTLSKRLATITLLLVSLVFLVSATAQAATDEGFDWSKIDWVQLAKIFLPAIGALLIQSPWVRAMGGKIQKLLPGATVEDGIKFEQILASVKGRDALLRWVRNYTLVLLVGILMCGVCGSATAQVVTTQTLAIPQVRSMSTTPPEQAFITKSFSLTYFHDGENDALGVPLPIWRVGKLSLAAVPILSAGAADKTQIGIVEAFGYDVDCKALLQKLGVKNVTVVLTPRYGPRQANGEKPRWVWGGTAEVKWTF